MCYLEAQRLATKVKTPIDELFGGTVLNTVICRECLEVNQNQLGISFELFVKCNVNKNN